MKQEMARGAREPTPHRRCQLSPMTSRVSTDLTRRALLQLGVGALVHLAGRGSALATTSGARLYLQPLGRELGEEDVALVRLAVTVMTGMETHPLPRVELPTAAFYPPRHRYRAERLLDFLDT